MCILNPLTDMSIFDKILIERKKRVWGNSFEEISHKDLHNEIIQYLALFFLI
jgi:DNA-directed RNA polymerase delta subunit